MAKKKSSPSSPKKSKKTVQPAKAVKVTVVDDDEIQPVPPDVELETSDIDENPHQEERALALPSDRSITTSDPVQLYLAEIRKYPLLTKEQEAELAKKYYETKDPKAAQALVTANLRFVVKVAAEYSKFGARLIDLIQEGNMGLMHAVREFNPYKGVRLITYAVWWIRGYIQEYLMKQYSLVKIGTTQNQKKLFYQLQREKEQIDKLIESGNLKELAKKLDIPEDEVLTMVQRLSGRDVSLDKPTDDGGTSLLGFQRADTEAPDETLAKSENLLHLNEAIEALRPTLNEKELIILKERILNDEPLTLQEIGEKYGTTREAVRQMEARLLKKIKDKFAEIESQSQD